MKTNNLAFWSLVAPVLLLAWGCVRAQDEAPESTIDRVMVIVNNDIITVSEFDARLAQLRSEIELNMQESGQQLAMPPEEVLREQLLERLIVESVQLQLAERGGIAVNDQQLDAAVEQLARSNGMSTDQLRVQMWRDGLEFDFFRKDLRRQLILRQLVESQVESRVRVSETDINEFLVQLGDQGVDSEFDLAHILIRVPESATPEQIQATEARAHEALASIDAGMGFAQAAVVFSEAEDALEGGTLGWRKLGQLPAIFTEALSGLVPGAHTGVIRSANGFHILNLVDKRGLGSETIIKTRARHILVQAASDLARQQAHGQLDSVRERILAGEDFETICRALSDDAVSATRGGDLGWLAPGDTVPPFEAAMEQLRLNELSVPVDSQFGVHLIQVLERRSEDAGDLMVRRNAAEQLHARKADEQYSEWVRELRDEAYVENLIEAEPESG